MPTRRTWRRFRSLCKVRTFTALYFSINFNAASTCEEFGSRQIPANLNYLLHLEYTEVKLFRALVRTWGLPITPSKYSCLTFGNLSPFSIFFLLFFHLFLRQTPTTEFSWSPASETWGSAWRDVHLVRALQRGCEYNKTVNFSGPPVFHGIT